MTEQVTYTGTARAFSTAAHGGMLAKQNETVEVGDELAAFLVENHDFERVAGDSEGEAEAEDGDLDDSEAGEWLTDFEGVGPAKADALEDAGYGTVEQVEDATVEDLAAVDGVSESDAETIKSGVGDGGE